MRGFVRFITGVVIYTAMLVWLRRCGLSDAGLWVAMLLNFMGYIEGKFFA